MTYGKLTVEIKNQKTGEKRKRTVLIPDELDATICVQMLKYLGWPFYGDEVINFKYFVGPVFFCDCIPGTKYQVKGNLNLFTFIDEKFMESLIKLWEGDLDLCAPRVYDEICFHYIVENYKDLIKASAFHPRDIPYQQVVPVEIDRTEAESIIEWTH